MISVKRNAATFIILVGLAAPALATLNLHPTELEQSAEGPPAKRYFFEDDAKHLTFRLDNKMSVSGSSDTATFRFDDLDRATMKISRSQLNPAVPFDEKNLATYRATVRALIGTEATNVQTEQEQANAIAINGWTSHQFVVTYDLFGFHYQRSITFLNYSATEQFIVDVTATADDYAKSYARGYRVLNSLTDYPVSNSGPT